MCRDCRLPMVEVWLECWDLEWCLVQWCPLGQDYEGVVAFIPAAEALHKRLTL